MLNLEQINEGLRLEERATRAPWTVYASRPSETIKIDSSVPDEPVVYTGIEGDGGVCFLADADLIVFLRNHARELLECAKRCGEMEKEIEELKLDIRLNEGEAHEQKFL